MIPLGALLAKLTDLRSQPPTRQCQRCGLSYPSSDSRCSHCGDLQGLELNRFLTRLEQDREDIANLGEFLFICSAIVLVILMLIMIMNG